MSNLKKMRELSGYSQSQLAKKSGVSVRMIQHYEQGRADINRAEAMTVWKLAYWLHCDVQDLLEFKD